MMDVNTVVFDPKHHLQRVGIGAILPGDLPLASVLPIADALLAAPVTAVEVQTGSHSSHIIHDLRQRAQGHMLIGLSQIRTAAEIDEAIAVGADFVSLAGIRSSLIKYCQQKGIFYMPTLQDLSQLPMLTQVPIIRVMLHHFANRDTIYHLCDRMLPGNVAVVGNITAASIPSYKQAGVCLIFAGTTLFHSPGQTMADIITRARRLQTMWDNH